MEPVIGSFIVVPITGNVADGLTEGASPITVGIRLADVPTANVTVTLAASPDLLEPCVFDVHASQLERGTTVHVWRH